MKYLTPEDNYFACDIEADNLKKQATVIWCVTVENVKTGERRSFTDGKAFREWKDKARPVLIGHNFLSYDAPMLNKFWSAGIKATEVIDTLVLSQVYSPSIPRPKGMGGREGAHSLKAWGLRLKCEKLEFDDFSSFSPEMLHYCAQDTKLTALLYRKLAERMRMVNFTEEGVELEHLSWNIIQNRQKTHGFPFNKKAGELLYATLRAREAELEETIYKLWPPELKPVKVFAKGRKQNGERTAGYQRHLGQYPKLEDNDDGSYVGWDWVKFDLGSPAQRIRKLLDLGWEPTNFTKQTEKGGGGNPKVDEDELIAFGEKSGNPEVSSLATWIVINSRANMVNTWLEAYDEETGAIHGSLNIASTLRYKHSKPNSANIPATRVKKIDGEDVILHGEEGMFTHECRALFDAGPDEAFCLVGIDGKGIQLRCLAHNVARMVGVEKARPFIERVLDGDPHTHNIKTLGLANKAAAKKFLYTTLMGGGGAKLAVDQAQFGTKLTAGEGNRLKNLLISSVPGFSDLIKYLQAELDKTGRITLCDGTPILVTSPHMVIPYQLQGDESRLMKKASIILDDKIGRERLRKDVFKVGDIHDEWQFKVRKSIIDHFLSLALPSFEEAGRHFSYLIPIEGDAKVGKTWAETH